MVSPEVEGTSITSRARSSGSSNDRDTLALQGQSTPSIGILPSAAGVSIQDGNVVGICGDSITAGRDVHYHHHHYSSSRSPLPPTNENQEPQRADASTMQSQRGMSSEYIPTRAPLPIQRSCDIYKRHLEAKGRGKCLWIPEPSKNLPIQYQRNGIAIGDVGIIHPSGRFIFLFNFCLPKGDSPNPSKMPTGFEPLPSDVIQELSISTRREFRENSFLASVSSVRVESDGDSTGLVFELSEHGGAILTMPVGANWYRYAYHDRGFEVRNGDLRVVMGCDKTSAWGMTTSSSSGAGFSSTGQESATLAPRSKLRFHLEYRPIESGDGVSKPKRYGWKYSGAAEVRTGPDAREIAELRGNDGGGGDNNDNDVVPENQCFFIRTLNITLSKRLWEDLGIYGLNRKGSFSPSASHNPAVITTSPRSGDVGLDHHITPGFFPSMSLADHPSNAINWLLLNNCSEDIAMAVTLDQDWISVLREDDSVLPTSEELLERITEAYDICEQDGLVFLDPKCQNMDKTFCKSSSNGKDNKSELISKKPATSSEGFELDVRTRNTPHLSTSVSDRTNINHEPPELFLPHLENNITIYVTLEKPGALDVQIFVELTRKMLALLAPLVNLQYCNSKIAKKMLVQAWELVRVINLGLESAQLGFTATEEIVVTTTLVNSKKPNERTGYLEGTLGLADIAYSKGREAVEVYRTVHPKISALIDTVAINPLSTLTSRVELPREDIVLHSVTQLRNGMHILEEFGDELTTLVHIWDCFDIQFDEGVQRTRPAKVLFKDSSLTERRVVKRWKNLRDQFAEYTSMVDRLEDSHYRMLLTQPTVSRRKPERRTLYRRPDMQDALELITKLPPKSLFAPCTVA